MSSYHVLQILLLGGEPTSSLSFPWGIGLDFWEPLHGPLDHSTVRRTSPILSPALQGGISCCQGSPGAAPAEVLAAPPAPYQLYASCSCSLAWSAVSMVMTSVKKSGPSSRQSARRAWGRLGRPAERDNTVNCSSGPSDTSSGPNTTLQREQRVRHWRASQPPSPPAHPAPHRALFSL